MDDSEMPMPRTQPDDDGGPPRPPKIAARAVEDDEPKGESILDEIQRRMRMRFPSATVARSSNSIAYIPSDKDGFIVRLTIKRGPMTRPRYVVHYGGSFEEFSSAKRALLEFAFGLATFCRVREYACRGKPYRWIVDLWDEKQIRWRGDWECVNWKAALRRIWMRPTIRYLQNHLIDLEAGDVGCAA